MPPFKLARNRDAFFVIRGFAFQVNRTILHWLNLPEHCQLELERGEDIDLVVRALAGPADEVERKLEQVKCRQANLTLRSSDALTALANAVEHRSENLDLLLSFLFFTNATPGGERPSPFDDKQPAIEVWEGIRTGKLSGQQLSKRLVGIRSILAHANKPPKLNADTWGGFQHFVTTTSNEQLAELIARFEWSTGQADTDQFDVLIRNRLVELGLSPHPTHAADLHARLFLYAMSLLSQPGRKQLAYAELRELSKLPTLNEHDQSVLNLITNEVFRLGRRLDDLEEQVEQLPRTDEIQAAIRKHYDSAGITASLTAQTPIASTELPPNVNNLCERKQTVVEMLAEVREKTWTAFAGTVGTGKTQFVTLLARELGKSVIYVPLRDLSIPQAVFRISGVLQQSIPEETANLLDKLIPRAIAAMETGTVIVIDDLPQLDGHDDLSREMIQIALACDVGHVHIISMSHHQLPSAILERLPPNLVTDLLTPSFTDSEAIDLFRAHGATNEFCESGNIELINVFASGNAMLLTAYARSLSQRGWSIGADDLERIRQQEHSSDVVDETIRRIVNTVRDEESRQVLYRLCLIVGQFGHDDLEVVANVEPRIERPLERLTSLSGLWIERQAREMMVVCPLAKPLSRTELSEECRQRVYLALANGIAARNRMTVLDAENAIVYFREAGEHDRLGLFLVAALVSSHALPNRQLAHLLLVSGIHQTLHAETDLGIRIVLRAQQASAAHRIGLEIEYLVDDLEELIDQASAAHAGAVYLASLLTLWIAAEIDFPKSLKSCERVIRLHSDVMAQINDAGTSPDTDDEDLGILDPSGLIWFNVTGVRTSKDLLDWIVFLDRLDDNTLKSSFDHPNAEVGSCAIVGRPWLCEHERPENERHWEPILETYERVATFAKDRQLELLWAAATRERIIILAENLDNIESALDVATTALEEELAGPRSEFLICDDIGRQFVYKKQYGEAHRWLTQAMAVPTEAYPSIRLRTPIEASRAIGDADPEAAIELVQRAVAHGRSNPVHVHELDMFTALGELGIAHALAGNLQAAFAAMNEAAERLIACKEDSDLWKQRFVAFGHAMGYFAKLANLGTPPETEPEGEEYVAPYRGFFLSTNTMMARHYDDEGYNEYEDAKFIPLMALFAEGVGDDEACVSWAMRGIDAARKAGILESISIFGQQVYPALLESGRITEGIDVAVECCSAMQATNVARRQEISAMETGQSVQKLLGEKPNENWNVVESWAVDRGVIPAVMHIGRVRLDAPETALQQAAELVHTCNEIAGSASNGELWQRTAETVESIFVCPKSASDLHELANKSAEAGDTTFHMLGYLGASLMPDTLAERAVIQHAALFRHQFLVCGHQSPVYRKVMLPFLVDYWQSTFHIQRFRFSSPSTIESELVTAIERPPETRAQFVLKTMIQGLRCQMPQQLADVRNWLQEA